jgi:hypothetical protein
MTTAPTDSDFTLTADARFHLATARRFPVGRVLGVIIALASIFSADFEFPVGRVLGIVIAVQVVACPRR